MTSVEATSKRPRGFLRQLFSSRPVAIGAAIFLAIILVSLCADLVTNAQPFQIRPRMRLHAPDSSFWFGTDALGRDVFSLVVFGGRLSLLVGFFVALVSATLGTVLGLTAGYFKNVDSILMRFMDAIMAIPGVLFAVALVSLVGPSLASIVGAIAFSEIPRVTRLVRSVVLTVREESYVKAAESMGIPTPLVLFRHILPSCVAPLIVQTTYTFAAAILMEAVLGFLGVGFPPDVPTWGNILANGRAVFQRGPWTIIAPGLFLAITVMTINILGDGLRDRLDPKLSRNAKVAA